MRLYISSQGLTTKNNKTYNINQYITEYETLEITEIHIPFFFNNINENNNVFHYELQGSSPDSITIPAGNYSINDLLNTINSSMNTKHATLTFSSSYNSVYNSVTFTASGNNFKLLNLNLNKEIFNVLNTSPTFTNSFTVQNIDINKSIRYIYISSNLKDILYNTPNHIRSVEAIDVIHPPNDFLKISLSPFKFGDTIHYKGSDLEHHKYKLRSNDNNISNISFSFYDVFGRSLDIIGDFFISVHLN